MYLIHISGVGQKRPDKPLHVMNRRTFVHRAGMAAASPAVLPWLGGSENVMQAGLTIKRLSWAGIQLEMDNTTLLIDAISRDIWNGNRSFPIIPLDISTRGRYALVTHLHNDHYDREALREALGERGRVICHKDILGDVLSDGLKIRSIGHYEPMSVGPFTVTAVPAVDGTGVLGGQVSWVIKAGDLVLFHGGDTMWHGHWWTFASYFGAVDIAFMPINGFRLTGRNLPEGVSLSMTPVQAATASRIMQAGKVVPIHYGVQDPEFYLEIPDALGVFQEEAKRQDVGVQVLEVGDSMTA